MPRPRHKTDAGTRGETLDWVRTPADERAIASGMRFDAERSAFACDWIESYCRLYEGDKAGQPMILLPYWREFASQLFGWVRWSEEWGGWVRRFVHAAAWLPKKQGKSPTCAAINLHLLAGDGEPGQKIYQAAKNGDQAKIAQRHAVEMVKQSPDLFADCKINNATLSITHLPTNSVLMILTGDDSRGAKAKEGLNGSVSFDEMHVVDREMFERVSRAGISRREPLVLSYSTAGDDPSSVGFERCQYGRQVNAGTRDDPTFFHVEYAAPEGVTDAEIDAHLDELGRTANPGWGALIKPTEFRADWQRSKGKPREVSRFKQYRLNVWVGSTNQWLDLAGWELGGDRYALADLAGRDCYAALDLSRTRDMTAAVLAFPWPEDGPEAVRLWPMFWLPRETALDRSHLFPFISWAQAGHVTLTDGAVVDYSVVKADIREAINDNSLNVLNLFYDPHYANEITQQLREGEGPVAGAVAERTAFNQSLMYFTGPAKEFERRVSAGLIRHPNNQVLNWQVGHCEVWSDRNQNIRPVKPHPNSGKAVDGVVCAVMTFAGLCGPAAYRAAYSPRFMVI